MFFECTCRNHLSNLCFLNLVTKGNSHNLLKAGAKRRRTKQEIERERLAEAERLQNIAERMDQVNRMEQELQALRQQQQDFSHTADAVEKLNEAGLLKSDQNCQFVAVENWQEHEHIL